MNLSNQIKASRISNAVAAGTTDINCTSVDMQGFGGVRFTALFGAITATAVTAIKVQQSSDNGSSDSWADLTGTSLSVADDDDNQVAILEINQPRERYLRLVVERGTANAVLDGAIAEQFHAAILPVSDDTATVVGREIHLAPSEGTA